VVQNNARRVLPMRMSDPRMQRMVKNDVDMPCRIWSSRGSQPDHAVVDEGTIRRAEIVPWLTKVQFLLCLAHPLEFAFYELHLIGRDIC
jgi:hypothetical protein